MGLAPAFLFRSRSPFPVSVPVPYLSSFPHVRVERADQRRKPRVELRGGARGGAGVGELGSVPDGRATIHAPPSSKSAAYRIAAGRFRALHRRTA